MPKDGSDLGGYNVHAYIALSWILIYARLLQKICKMQLKALEWMDMFKSFKSKKLAENQVNAMNTLPGRDVEFDNKMLND